MFKTLFTMSLLLITTACARIGPDIIQAGGNDYNIAIQHTNDEQLLLNLIRLKYRDTPFFMEVNSVSSQFKLVSEAALSANFKKQKTPENVGLSGSLTFTEQPTVTYLPLHGGEFIQRLLAPVSLDTILLLANSGWSIERILRLTVQSINGIPNAPTASGPTPKTAPEYKAFQRVAKLMRELQSNGLLQLAYKQQNDSHQAAIIFNENHQSDASVQTLKEALGLDNSLTDFQLLPGTGSSSNNKDIVIATRSLLGVMYYLSHSVDVPEQDKTDGKVTITQTQDGDEFDWTDLTQDLFKINTSSQNENDSAIGTNYRGSWFYIDDSDLDSKTTFSLLTQLFALQAGKAEGITPVLTLPIGN